MNNIIIYGSTRERAFQKLEELLNNMRYGDVKQVKKFSGHFSVELKNGDYYLAISANDYARGYRWQYAFVDRLINKEILDNIVFAKFIPLDKNGKMDYGVEIQYRFEWF